GFVHRVLGNCPHVSRNLEMVCGGASGPDRLLVGSLGAPRNDRAQILDRSLGKIAEPPLATRFLDIGFDATFTHGTKFTRCTCLSQEQARKLSGSVSVLRHY